MKKNYFLDWLLFLCILACLVTGILLDFHLIPGGREGRAPFRNIHRYSGYLMAVAILLHLLWHRAWIAMTTRSIFKSKNEND
jgi:cytochrome b561